MIDRALLCLLLTACEDVIASPRPNYEEDIYPIAAQHCLACHTASGVGGLVLDDYSTTLAALPHLQHVIAGREMPPWGTDDGGKCGQWSGARWLAPEEMATILAWVNDGAPEGDRSRRRLPPPSPAIESLHDPESLHVGAGYMPSPGAGTQRCFVVDPMLPSDRFLTGLGFDFAASPVLRIALFALDSADAEAQAMARDGADGQPGFSCAGQVGSRFLLAVTAASQTLRLPDQTGVALGAGRKVIVQVDYDLYVPAREVVAELELATFAQPGRWIEVRVSTLALAPNQINAYAQTSQVVSADMTVLGVYPQMRLYGTGLYLTSEPDGCLVRQVQWNMHLLREPRFRTSSVPVHAQSQWALLCTYDTTAADATIYDGDTLDDEECAVSIYTLANG